MSRAVPFESCLVVGFGATGRGVARVLSQRGVECVAVDDNPGTDALLAAGELGVDLLETPSAPGLSALVANAGIVVVSPGISPRHPVFARATTTELISEIELAGRLSEIPIVAITGTNGKTTVTALVTAMLEADGRAVRAAGNFGPTLIEAVTDPTLEIVVAEISSFQLALTTSFAPRVATFLNIAEDHLDWHVDFEDYLAAKSRIFAFQRPSDVAVANTEDPLSLRAATAGRARVVGFGRGGEYHLEGDAFVSADGVELARREDLWRSLPHDELNALAALATAREAGASPTACRAGLRAFEPLPHRVSEVATIEGATWYDDSKATTPSAAVAALEGFPCAVLICGGRNKGLDLSEIARFAAAHPEHRVRGVVAIGEAAGEVIAAFADHHVVPAGSMREAVRVAHDLARPGDAVLLSPGCASFDWYRSYAERGDEFIAEVRALGDGTTPARARGGAR